MKTTDESNPFQKVYWNLIQTLAWVHLRKDDLVKLADDDVTDVSNGRPTVLLIELYGSQYGASYKSVAKAGEALIKKLQINTIVCYGIANNNGELKEIPAAAWADLKFLYDPDIAAPKNPIGRINTTKWHRLKFKVSEILKFWPSTNDTNKTKEYKPRNIIYKKALKKLTELDDLDYGWKRIVEITQGIDLNDEGTLVIGTDDFGQPVKVGVKSFQNTFSKMRNNLKNKKDQ